MNPEQGERSFPMDSCIHQIALRSWAMIIGGVLVLCAALVVVFGLRDFRPNEMNHQVAQSPVVGEAKKPIPRHRSKPRSVRHVRPASAIQPTPPSATGITEAATAPIVYQLPPITQQPLNPEGQLKSLSPVVLPAGGGADINSPKETKEEKAVPQLVKNDTGKTKEAQPEKEPLAQPDILRKCAFRFQFRGCSPEDAARFLDSDQFIVITDSEGFTLGKAAVLALRGKSWIEWNFSDFLWKTQLSGILVKTFKSSSKEVNPVQGADSISIPNDKMAMLWALPGLKGRKLLREAVKQEHAIRALGDGYKGAEVYCVFEKANRDGIKFQIVKIVLVK